MFLLWIKGKVIIVKLNRKGYLAIEIILASVIAFAIAFFLMELTVKLVNKNDDIYRDTMVDSNTSLVVDRILSLNSGTLYTYEIVDNAKCENNSCAITYKNKDNEKVYAYITANDKTITLSGGNDKGTYEIYKKKFDNSIGEINITSSTNGPVGEDDSVYLKLEAQNIFTGKTYSTIIPIYNSVRNKYPSNEYFLVVKTLYKEKENIISRLKIGDDTKNYYVRPFVDTSDISYDDNVFIEDITCDDESFTYEIEEDKYWTKVNFIMDGLSHNTTCTITIKEKTS